MLYSIVYVCITHVARRLVGEYTTFYNAIVLLL